MLSLSPLRYITFSRGRNCTTDEQKAMPRVEHDHSFLRRPRFENLVEFAFVEYTQNEIKNRPETARLVIGERAFFKNYDCAKEFFKLIDYMDYFCFQYERGETGNLYLQGFIHYSCPMDMKVVRNTSRRQRTDRFVRA